MPVIYHDFLMSETGTDSPLHTLSFEQVSVEARGIYQRPELSHCHSLCTSVKHSYPGVIYFSRLGQSVWRDGGVK